MSSTTRFLVFGLVLTCGLVPAVAAEEGHALTTVILVRHAEKVLVGEDPPLNSEGEERARRLAYMLSAAGVDTIYSTPFARTLQTAKPLASRLGLEVVETPVSPTYAADMAKKVRETHAGDVVVIVGHSNTTPDVVRAFGLEVDDVPESDYDNLFVVTFSESTSARLLRLRF